LVKSLNLFTFLRISLPKQINDRGSKYCFPISLENVNQTVNNFTRYPIYIIGYRHTKFNVVSCFDMDQTVTNRQ
jgi:hypothetical protein